MSDLIRLFIDGRPVEAAPGTLVIDAAERLGIMIPRFCYHPALGGVGACRMCAVMFTDGPVKGLQMSCTTKAKAGMVVETAHPEAMDFRRHVVEWLMANHPHDCPVCDEGGHCLLQDETISGGHALRRYPALKRTYRDQYLGPFVQHQMNRCIHCYRCARFYQEYAGYRDYGVMQSANRVYFGRYMAGRLESPFSGNLIDICPTGALTDRPSRDKGRRWDYQRAPSICTHCSLGCATVPSVRYREVMRVEARFNPAVNGYFICDRGRYSFDHVNSPKRPRTATAGGLDVPAANALSSAAARLGEIMRQYGERSVAVLTSPRASLETLAMLRRLAGRMGWRPPAAFPTRAAQRKARLALAGLAEAGAGGRLSLAGLASADCILVLGADPVREAPMLALALRQAARRGATVAVVDPRPVNLPFEHLHLSISPTALTATIRMMTRLAAGDEPGDAPKDLSPLFDRLAPALAASRRPAVVAGSALPGVADLLAAQDLARALRQAKGTAGFFPLAEGPDASGAALFEGRSALSGEEAPVWADVLGRATDGSVKAVVAVECDPFFHLPELDVSAALDRLHTLVVLDHLPTVLVRRATFFVPSQPVQESGGFFLNQEARLQYASPVFAGGLPASRDGGGGHPPREYDHGFPAGAPRPAWEILADLWRALDCTIPPPAPDTAMDSLDPGLAECLLRPLPEEGAQVALPDLTAWTSGLAEEPASEPAPLRGEPHGHALILTDALFASDEQGAHSALARENAELPELFCPPGMAAVRGLADGAPAHVQLGGASFTCRVRVTADMAKGTAVLTRHPDLPLRPVPASGPIRLDPDDLKPGRNAP